MRLSAFTKKTVAFEQYMYAIVDSGQSNQT